MSSTHWPRTLERIAWPTALVLVLPTAMVTARILRPEGAVIATAKTHHTAAVDRVRTMATARTTARGSSSTTTGIKGLLFQAVWFGALFVMVDELGGLDILYTTFGLDVIPKTRLQKRFREHRALWREARASGSPIRVRETFFQLRRERFDLMDVKYQEEPMKTFWDMGRGRPAELLDPADVRVFFILSKGSRGVTAKIYIAFNVERPGEAEMREKVDKTTKWILTRQVESRLAEGRLEMPCKLERVYRDWSEGEHLLQHSRNEDGSSTLAGAWDRRQTIFVADDGTRSAM